MAVMMVTSGWSPNVDCVRNVDGTLDVILRVIIKIYGHCSFGTAVGVVSLPIISYVNNINVATINRKSNYQSRQNIGYTAAYLNLSISIV